MSVHYRFKSALEYDTITFDGLHISVKDLKNAIIQQKRIGKSTDFDLQVTNAQTKEVYDDENTLIPKNTSLLIARIPIAVPKTKQWEGYGGNDTPPAKLDEAGSIAKTVDLSSLDAPEDDKIKAMMLQSTQDYDPSNYSKIRGSNQVGPVPPNYRCYKCHQGGHWIKDCPLGQGTDAIEVKKPTGIPVSLLVQVEGPQVQGAMMTPNGQYAVPALDHQAYTQKNSAPAPVQEPKPEIPEDLLCSICSDLMTDAVMIPCCGNSFCDECIRSVLLESDEHECPDCHEKDIAPTTLIPNRFLRKSVANFKNTTGYEKKFQTTHSTKVPIDKKSTTPPPEVDTTEKELIKEEEKTVISEADSTEQARNVAEVSKEIEPEIKPKSEAGLPEGPPGVSPSRKSPKSPRYQISSKVNSGRENKENREKRVGRERRDSRERSSKHYKHRPDSPRKHRSHHHSPKYESGPGEDRPGTPTRDEPGLSGNYPSTSYGSNNMGHMMRNMPMTGPITNIPPPYNQGPPLPGFPPNQGPPPNFRLPPPGGPGAPPYMPPGYPVPPRPVFDPTRPPISGPAPYNAPPNFGGGRPHRDFPGRRVRDRTPPGIIDDPLAAFNRILREKDERRKRRRRGSWSRSRSRSPRSFSRSPRRNWSRSPRRRQSRSRSRSFSLSRSRSRSYHSPLRGPSPPYRGSPRRSPPPPRRGPGRYHSPPRQSPPRRRPDRERDFRDTRDRYKDRRDDRDYEKDRGPPRDRFYDNYDERRGRAWGQGPVQAQARPQEAYYPPPEGFQNRYQPRGDYGPPVVPPPAQNAPPRRFEDIAPPGVEEPPVPGMENEPPRIDKFEPKPEEKRRSRSRSSERKRRTEKKEKSRSPEKWRNPSPHSKSKTPERSPDKHRRKRRESSSDREDDRRRSKDKKKHKDKREKDKKKKDKREKHKKSEKERKPKEEFKQVIPKRDEPQTLENIEEMKRLEAEAQEKLKVEEEEARKLRELRRKEEEGEEKRREEKRVIEEKKKEERRLRFLEDEKKIKQEDERKRKLEEERKKKEGSKRKDEEKKKSPVISLYDEEPEGFVQEPKFEGTPEEIVALKPEEMEEGEVGDEAPSKKDIEEEEESGVLELHSSDMDLKVESDILAPLPGKSRWEVEEDGQALTSPTSKEKLDPKSQKVSNEVLKRAENAIFAKAINAIRPIEIKKVSADRAKLYSGERDVEKKERTLELTVPAAIEVKKVDLTQEKPRVSVKDRLGVKVDDSDRVVKVDKRRSRTVSPFSRRERRMDDEFRRHDRNRRSRSRRRDNNASRRRAEVKRDDRGSRRTDRKDERQRSKSKHKDDKDKRKRSRSRSKSEERRDKKKKKEKKTKKDKEKPKKEPDDKEEAAEDKPKSATAKRKPTLDEANFEPDYDLELHNSEEDNEEKRKERKAEPKKETEESSSSESETSSSEDDHNKKKKKHRKHRRKKRRESSSSSEDSSEESSDSEKDKKRKHKKSKKKKKKSKHK